MSDKFQLNRRARDWLTLNLGLAPVFEHLL